MAQRQRTIALGVSAATVAALLSGLPVATFANTSAIASQPATASSNAAASR